MSTLTLRDAMTAAAYLDAAELVQDGPDSKAGAVVARFAITKAAELICGSRPRVNVRLPKGTRLAVREYTWSEPDDPGELVFFPAYAVKVRDGALLLWLRDHHQHGIDSAPWRHPPPLESDFMAIAPRRVDLGADGEYLVTPAGAGTVTVLRRMLLELDRWQGRLDPASHEDQGALVAKLQQQIDGAEAKMVVAQTSVRPWQKPSPLPDQPSP